MGLPLDFLAKFSASMVVSLLLMKGKDLERIQYYDAMLETSDDRLMSLGAESEGEVFDYVVIGAGSAGSVLANRLSASGQLSVLLLEGGGDPNPISEIPLGLVSVGSSSMVVPYQSIPMKKACRAKSGGRCYFGRGRGLGGSSSVNGMVYNRCNPNNYDAWANFTHDDTWNYKSVLAVYKSLESYHGHYKDSSRFNASHGADGDVHIGTVYDSPSNEFLLRALQEQNIPVGDLNSEDFRTGFSRIDYNVKDGLRHGAYAAFLKPILDRPNLKIYRYASATKINVNATSKEVSGVTYRRHGKEKFVGVRKEVILSAGAIDSPKLLMLSGIGPTRHLSDVGIETLLNLPAVGTYLQEQFSITVPSFSLNVTTAVVDPFTTEHANDYVQNAQGPLLAVPWHRKYAPHLVHGYMSSSSNGDPSFPDLHIYVNEEVLLNEGQPPLQLIFPIVELVRPRQTGTLRLASSHPLDPPLIDPRVLDDPGDLERLVEGLQFMVRFFQASPTYAAMGIQWANQSLNGASPGDCDDFPFASTDYWRCYVESNTATALHTTSTCRMGPNSTVAVVDSKLRVFGVEGLRVVDASVIPFVPTGNTNFPAMLVGELGARIILNLM